MAKPLPTQAGAPNPKVCAWGFRSTHQPSCQSPAEKTSCRGQARISTPGLLPSRVLRRGGVPLVPNRDDESTPALLRVDVALPRPLPWPIPAR